MLALQRSAKKGMGPCRRRPAGVVRAEKPQRVEGEAGGFQRAQDLHRRIPRLGSEDGLAGLMLEHLEKFGIADLASVEGQRGHAVEQLRPSGLYLKIFAVRAGGLRASEPRPGSVRPRSTQSAKLKQPPVREASAGCPQPVPERSPSGIASCQPSLRNRRKVSRSCSGCLIGCRRNLASNAAIGSSSSWCSAKETGEHQPAQLILQQRGHSSSAEAAARHAPWGLG